MFERTSLLSRVARKFGSLVDQALVSGGNFLTIAICAHTLPLAEQGKFTYVFASYMALLLLNVAGIFQGAAVRAPVQGESYRGVLARLQLFQALLFACAVCGLWFGFGHIFGWSATNTEAILLFAFLLMQQMADFDRRMAYVFDSASRAIYSSAVLYPWRIAGLLIYRPESVSQVLMVLAISAMIPALFGLKAVARNISISWISAVKAHLVYSRLFIIGAPLGWLWAYIPVFLLGVVHGKEQAALLASIRGISNMANVLMEQLETKIVADWARMHHGSDAEAMGPAVVRLLKIGMIFWLVGMAVVGIFGREIVSLVLGALYEPHWILLVIGWVAYGVYFLARVSGIKHRTLGSNHVEFIGNLCGVFAAIFASITLIDRYKEIGAAWVYVIIAAVMLISQVLVTKKLRLHTK